MKDRIRQIMETMHMTQNVFAEFLGQSPATISGIFTGRTRPTLNIVDSIKEKIPTLNTDWLLYGQGEMYRQSSSSADAASGASSSPPAAGMPSPVSGAAQEQTLPFASSQTGVHGTLSELPRDYVVRQPERSVRRVTEIRVFYDDQTWESFVPGRK